MQRRVSSCRWNSRSCLKRYNLECTIVFWLFWSWVVGGDVEEVIRELESVININNSQLSV